MSHENQRSSDDEEDEYIAKIRAAAKNKQKLGISTNIQKLAQAASSKEKEDSGTASNFFAHATAVLAKRVNFFNDGAAYSKKNDESMDEENQDQMTGTDAHTAVPNSNHEIVDIDDDDDPPIATTVRSVGDEPIITLDDTPFQPTERPITLDDTSADDEDLDNDIFVRVMLNGKLQKFCMHQNEKFEKIFQSLAQLERVSVNDISILREGWKELKQSDTVRGLEMKNVEILECTRKFVYVPPPPPAGSKKIKRKITDENCIMLKLQHGGVRCIVELMVNVLDTFEIIKEKYAKERAIDISKAKKLRFIFDGDDIPDTQTPRDLDMETGDCIDVL